MGRQNVDRRLQALEGKQNPFVALFGSDRPEVIIGSCVRYADEKPRCSTCEYEKAVEERGAIKVCTVYVKPGTPGQQALSESENSPFDDYSRYPLPVASQ